MQNQNNVSDSPSQSSYPFNSLSEKSGIFEYALCGTDNISKKTIGLLKKILDEDDEESNDGCV